MSRSEAHLQRPADAEALGQLTELGLVRQTADGWTAVPRLQAIDRILTEQAQLLRATLAEVHRRQRILHALITVGPDLDEAADPVDGVVLDAASGSGPGSLPPSPTRELLAIQPGARFSADVLEQSLIRAQGSIEAGVELRVVHQSALLQERVAVRYLEELQSLGAMVRVRESVPFRMLLVDRETAMCELSDEGGTAEDAFLLRGRRVITLLERVFEAAWLDASPVGAAQQGRLGGAPPLLGGGAAALEARYNSLTEQQQFILRCLAEGDTDQSIARRAGVTTRTVSRRIAEIYQVLGVESRFQAGVAAHQLGLV